jgi:hypothetical protein
MQSFSVLSINAKPVHIELPVTSWAALEYGVNAVARRTTGIISSNDLQIINISRETSFVPVNICMSHVIPSVDRNTVAVD